MKEYCYILIPVLFLFTGCEKNKIENNGPVASSLTIEGFPYVNYKLTAHYIYSDPEDDKPGGEIYQWYTASDSLGNGSEAIVGATSKSYQILCGDLGKYIGFSVIPKTRTGTGSGNKAVTERWAGIVTYDESIKAFAKRIIGKWDWIKDCGGWSDDCNYPVIKHTRILEITDNMFITTSYHNSDSVQNILNYTLKSRLRWPEMDTTFSIVFYNNEHSLPISVHKDELGVAGGDYWSYYERIR